MPVERIARLVEVDVLGQHDGEVFARLRHDTAGSAMQDRDRAAPVALARDAPVAQAVVHLAAGLRGAEEIGALQPFGDGLEGLVRRLAVEKGRIVDHAVIDIGLVADRERHWILMRRQHDGAHRQAVFAGEIEVALVMGRAAEDRAGAVIHQDEIRDIDRQRASSGSSGCTASMPVATPFFSAVSMAAAVVPVLRVSSMKAASAGLFAAAFCASG